MTRGSLTLKLGQLTPEIMLNTEYDENITSNSVPFAEKLHNNLFFFPIMQVQHTEFLL